MGTMDLDYGLFGRLRAASGDEWTNYVNHPFVKQIGNGTLSEACFRRYLTQDYLYLHHYARAYGLLAFKSKDFGDIQYATKSLNSIINELPVHLAYCAKFGMSEEMMAREPEASETMTYTRFVLDVGMAGDMMDLMVALIPCAAGYGELAQILQSEATTVLEDNPYVEWIESYSSERYQSVVTSSIVVLDEMGKRLGGEVRFERLLEIFNTATRLESEFWQMGLNAETTTTRIAAE